MIVVLKAVVASRPASISGAAAKISNAGREMIFIAAFTEIDDRARYVTRSKPQAADDSQREYHLPDIIKRVIIGMKLNRAAGYRFGICWAALIAG